MKTILIKYHKKQKRRWSRMISFMLLGTLMICGLTGKAQNDSIAIEDRTNIQTVLHDRSIDNPEKLLLLRKMARLYKNENASRAVPYYEAMVTIAKQLQDHESLINSYLKLANLYQKQFLYAKTDSIYKILLPYYKNKKEEEIAQYYYLRGTNYYQWSHYKMADTYLQKALNIYEKLGIVAGQAKTLKEEARIWANYNDYPKTIGLLQRSAEKYQQLGDQEGLASIQTLMGTIMESWGRLQQAKNYYHEAYQSAIKRNNQFDQANNLLHIGDIEVLRENYRKAIGNYQKAKKISLQIHHNKLYSIALSNLGEAYYHLRQYDSALFYQRLSVPIKKQIDDRRRLAISMYDLSLIYYQQNKFKEAIAYADSALRYAENIKAKELEMKSLWILSEINKARHWYRTAYDYLKLYVKLNNEVFNEKNRKMVNQMEVRYQADQKERENQKLRHLDTENKLRLEKEKSRNTMLFILLGFVFTTTLIIGIFLHYRRILKNKQHALELERTRKIKQQAIELKKLTNELMVSREKYKSIVENATIGIYKTTPDGKVIFVNKTLCNLLGYTEKELKRLNLNKEKPHRQEFVALLEEQGIITGRQDIWTRADGKKIYVKESAWIIRDTSGKVLNYEGLIEDITEQKKAEEQVEQANKRLKTINKELRNRNVAYKKAKTEAEEANRAKTLFLANISHEIRTPLNSIIGYTKLLYPLIEDEIQKDYLNSIETSSQNLLLLINDILDLSKIQEGKMEINQEPYSFEEIINETKTFFFPLVNQKGITLKTHMDDELSGMFLIDKIRIRQILFNLVGNAVKFTDHGFVLLSMKVEQIDRDQQHYQIKIDIQDSGKGIAKEEQKNIFKPFEQGGNQKSKPSGGTGLGLNIAKRLVEIMGGTIQLESEPGKGSTFSILLNQVKKVTTGNRRVKQTSDIPKQHPSQQDLTKNQPEDIDPELVTLLSDNFYDQWINVQENMFVKGIKYFGEQLLSFSRKRKLQGIAKDMEKLIKACEHYDIETIEKIFHKISIYFTHHH